MTGRCGLILAILAWAAVVAAGVLSIRKDPDRKDWRLRLVWIVAAFSPIGLGVLLLLLLAS